MRGPVRRPGPCLALFEKSELEREVDILWSRFAGGSLPIRTIEAASPRFVVMIVQEFAFQLLLPALACEVPDLNRGCIATAGLFAR